MRYANGVPVHFVLEKARLRRRDFRLRKGKTGDQPQQVLVQSRKAIAAELLKKVDAAEEEKKWSDHTALWQAKWHMQNWLDCIRTRKTAGGGRRDRPSLDQRLPSGEHYPSSWSAAEMGPGQEQFLGDDEANQLVDRPRRKGYELPNPV